MSKNQEGNVLINSLLALILAAIILTSISTSTISSYILQDKMFAWSKEVKEARIATQVLILDTEQHLVEQYGDYTVGMLNSFLLDYTSTDNFCTYNSSDKYYDGEKDIFPITCTVGGAEITTNIIVVDYAPSLYDYVLGTDGDLYLNGTSFIGGNLFAEKIYSTNHTLNGQTAISLETIKPLLDEVTDPETQYNYVHFNKGLTIGTNIYTPQVLGCYADKLNGCYTINNDTNDIVSMIGDTDVTNVMEQFTHELNYGTELPIMNTDFNIDIPLVDLGKQVSDIIYSNTDIKWNKHFGAVFDPYNSYYNIEDDILCYTNKITDHQGGNDGYNCKGTYIYNTTSTTIKNINPLTFETGYENYASNALPDVVFANENDKNYQVVVDPAVTNLKPAPGNVLIIDGDLIINDMNSPLELGGTIIVSGDVKINGNIDELKLTGTLYSFGTININVKSVNGLTNGNNDFGFMFAKEHIIINANREFYGVDESSENYNMNGYLYAEGSILIEADAYSSLNINGGVYAKANPDISFPEIEIDGRRFIYDGIMINSYSGEITDKYVLDKNPYKSRFVVKPHQADELYYQNFINRLDVPSEFKDEIGPQDFVTAYKEVLK